MSRPTLDGWMSRKLGVPFTRAALEAYQLRALNETLAWARTHAAYYRDRLPQGGLRALSELASLPFTTPEALYAAPYDFLCVSPREVERIVTVETSGSAGEKKRLFFTRDDLELCVDFFDFGMRLMVDGTDKVGILFPASAPASVGDQLAKGLARAGVPSLPLFPLIGDLPRLAAHRHLPIADSAYFCHQAANPNDFCAWNPDMYGLRCDRPEAAAYYRSIFKLYASWGVDFVKCDDIAREYPRCAREIELISDACRGCGREIVLSLSPGPAPLDQAEHLKRYANMWRITDDFWDSWAQLKPMFERAEKWCVHAGPGHWPDADMLPLGAVRQCEDPSEWTRFTPAEQRTMMTLWCIMRSPLMIGGELTKNDDFTLSLLTNQDVLDVQRQSWCAHPLWTTEEESIWVAPCVNGTDCYVALFNLSNRRRRVSLPAEAMEMSWFAARELWTGATRVPREGIHSLLSAHDAAIWHLSDSIIY